MELFSRVGIKMLISSFKSAYLNLTTVFRSHIPFNNENFVLQDFDAQTSNGHKYDTQISKYHT